MKQFLWLWLPIFFLGSLVPMQAQDIEVQTLLDRPVFFVGQPFHYQVRVLYAPSVEFVMERFDQQNFQLEPFEVQSVRVSHSREEGFGVLSIHMDLVTFEIKTEAEGEVWEIPSFVLYYSRDGASVVDVLSVPGTPVAFGRTVPEESVRIRDEISYEERPAIFWLALLLGFSGIVVAGVPVGLSVYRNISGETVEISLERSEIRKKAHRAVVELKSKDVAEAEEVLSFYQGLADALRKYGGRLGEKRGLSLTVEEYKTVLLEVREDAGEVDRLVLLLALADEVGHSRSGMEKGRNRLEEAHREALSLLE